jgi:hypothetical protein
MQYCFGWERKGLSELIKSLINARVEEALKGHVFKDLKRFGLKFQRVKPVVNFNNVKCMSFL